MVTEELLDQRVHNRLSLHSISQLSLVAKPWSQTHSLWFQTRSALGFLIYEMGIRYTQQGICSAETRCLRSVSLCTSHVEAAQELPAPSSSSLVICMWEFFLLQRSWLSLLLKRKAIRGEIKLLWHDDKGKGDIICKWPVDNYSGSYWYTVWPCYAAWKAQTLEPVARAWVRDLPHILPLWL